MNFNIDGLAFVPERTTGNLVLLAEDDCEMRRLLAEALTTNGYDVVEAASGRELVDILQLEIANGRKPALVVSDIRMPEMTGLDVLRAVRKQGSEIPFILITAFGDEEILNEAARLETPLLFRKPFEIEDLLTVVAFFA